MGRDPLRPHSRLDDRWKQKYGHGWYKVYEDGDEDRPVFPERDTLCGKGMILYHRYKKIQPRIGSDEHVYMTVCPCNHYGNLCRDCRPLNTTTYEGLEVPICPEDFMEMKRIVFEADRGWTPTRWFAWLDLWITILENRRTGRGERAVFFDYAKFSVCSSYSTPHRFFRYILEFIQKKRWSQASCDWGRSPQGTVRPLALHLSDTETAVRSGDAMLRWTLLMYAQGRSVRSMHTDRNHRRRGRWTRLRWTSLDETPILDRMCLPWMSLYSTCMASIRDEVAFRPGMVEMIRAGLHFEEMRSIHR